MCTFLNSQRCRPLSSYAQGQLLAFIQRMDGPKLQCWSLRYRVQMTVSLASDSAEFVAFDSDISKLTNIRAAEISQQMKTQVSETPQSWALPQCIEGIVGRTFQLKFSRLKFLYKHQSFTVSRIYDTHRCRPQPGGDNNPGDDMPGGGAVKICHPAENRRDLDIRCNIADGNVAGQTSAPNG
ncbi:hypothetical protein YC2023_077880 [Brassica napus]